MQARVFGGGCYISVHAVLLVSLVSNIICYFGRWECSARRYRKMISCGLRACTSRCFSGRFSGLIDLSGNVLLRVIRVGLSDIHIRIDFTSYNFNNRTCSLLDVINIRYRSPLVLLRPESSPPSPLFGLSSKLVLLGADQPLL